LLNFACSFLIYLDNLVILSQPLSLTSVSSMTMFNPFLDFLNSSPQPVFLLGNYPSISLFPICLSTPFPPIPPPLPSCPHTERHENIHKVDGKLSIGYLSNPVFVWILSPNGPFISLISWFLCEHSLYCHTQTFLTTTDICNKATTTSSIDKLSFYVTAHGSCKGCSLHIPDCDC
jgi:hypothetical protein